MAYHYVWTLSLFCSIVFALVALGIAAAVWSHYIDIHINDLRAVRAAMVLILLLAFTIELVSTALGTTSWWWPALCFIVDFWGGLDAILRFPAQHQGSSLCSVKQLTLQMAKAVGLPFSFRNFRPNVCIFVIAFILDVIALPLLYVMAVPLDPAKQVALDEGGDVDLVVRVWRLAQGGISTPRQHIARSVSLTRTALCAGWCRRLGSAEKANRRL
mmetsp:Transcript_7050/g.15173  ORF Transcript_7050/g.15173 Transcript_7050/m.15173 type:complete len:215 (-) Transcript_7050:24-668(-)